MSDKYSSPLRKLVKFFEQSRDNWKAKYVDAKKTIKLLQNQERRLTKSRDKWKQEVAQLKAENRALKKALEVQAAEKQSVVEPLKKNFN